MARRPVRRTRPAPAGEAAPALPGPVARGGRETALIVLAAVALQGVAWIALLALLGDGRFWYGFFDVSDIVVYFDYAGKVAAGQRVYRDFPFEYPPLALPLFVLPPHAAYAAYQSWFATEMIVLCSAAAALTAATAAALWRGLARPLAVGAAYAAAVLAAGAITANRYDAAVALTIAACVFFLARRLTVAAGAALGIGVALKLTPGMLLPLVLILAGGRRRVVYALAAFVVFAALPFVPYLSRLDGLANIVTYHADRPLQIESVPGTPYLIAGAMDAGDVGAGTSFGSQSLAGPGSETVAQLAPWVGVALVAGVYALVWRRRELLRVAPQYIPLAALACVLVFTVCNKVLSPQFLVWTFPLLALVLVGEGRGQRLTGLLTLAAIVLTHVEFPDLYWRVVDLEPGPVAVVAIRNLVLVGAAAAAVVTLWRLPAAVEAGGRPTPARRR